MDQFYKSRFLDDGPILQNSIILALDQFKETRFFLFGAGPILRNSNFLVALDRFYETGFSWWRSTDSTKLDFLVMDRFYETL
jgi:hypothetical protein